MHKHKMKVETKKKGGEKGANPRYLKGEKGSPGGVNISTKCSNHDSGFLKDKSSNHPIYKMKKKSY